MKSEFAKIIYAKINGIPWQPQIAKFVSRQKKRLYGTIKRNTIKRSMFLFKSFSLNPALKSIGGYLHPDTFPIY